MGPASPAYDNTNFGYYNDDGSESGSSTVFATGTDGDLNTNTIYRMRFELTETAGVSDTNAAVTVEYNWSGAPGWNSVAASEAPIWAVSSKENGWTITDADDTTQRLGGGGTFVSPNAGYTEDGTAGGNALDFAGSDITEIEVCFFIPGQQVADNDTIQMRVGVNGQTNSYNTTPTIVVNKPTVPFDQVAWRGRNDDNTETLATWIANENVDWTQDTDANFRLRFSIDNDGDAPNDNHYEIQYNKNAAGWNAVTGSSTNVRLFDSIHFISGDNTTDQMTAGQGTFVVGEMQEATGTAGHSNFTGASEHTQWEWCVQIRSADVSGGDTIDIRAVADGDVFTTYSQTPTITVTSGVTTVPIAAAVTASASVTANLFGSKPLAAAATGSAAVTANLFGSKPLATAVSGAANVVAALDVFKMIEAAVSAPAIVTAALSVTHNMATAVTASASATAALDVIHNMETAVNVSASVAASLFATKPLAAIVNAPVIVTASLSTFKTLTAAANPAASVVAGLTVTHNMLTAVNPAATATGALRVDYALATAISPAAAVVADLTVIPSGPVLEPIAAVVNAPAVVTGALSLDYALAASVNAGATVTANLYALKPIAASVTATGTATADLYALKPLAAAINPVVITTAALSVTHNMIAASNPTTTVTAGMAVDYALAVAVTADASVVAGLTVITATLVPITTTVNTATTVSAALKMTSAVAAAVTGSAATVAGLTITSTIPYETRPERTFFIKKDN